MPGGHNKHRLCAITCTKMKILFSFCIGISFFLAVGYAQMGNNAQRIIDTERRSANNDDSLRQEITDLNKKVKDLESTIKTFPEVKFRSYKDRKRILITGGAGFVGSHLVDVLMLEGHEVTVADNFFTGRKRNVEHWLGHENFELLNHDIVHPLFIEGYRMAIADILGDSISKSSRLTLIASSHRDMPAVKRYIPHRVDQIYHLASPASPPNYMYNPVKTIKTNTMGTINMLGLAKRNRARLLFTSTSEVYGDPEVHPQTEDYWGHVNPIGPRACYDEAKRVAETMCYAYQKQDGVEVRVARIFNTFGPRMHMNDGRVVSNFILQALQSEPITIYGSGEQTRSFQYVSDLVDGLIALMNGNYSQPVNLGNPEEYTISEFAKRIRDISGSRSEIVHKSAMEDDPQRRKPDITTAMKQIKWKPKVPMWTGINKTIEYFRNEISRTKHSERNVWVPEGLKSKDFKKTVL